MESNDLVDDNHGKKVFEVFKYIQRIFRETAQLMEKLDSLMGNDWISTYGNRTTRDVTTSLRDPDSWIVEASFRIYENKNKPKIKKGITIAYWSEGIYQPILIAGKMVYSRPKKHEHWDLWNLWFREDYKKKRIDGSIISVKPKDNKLKSHIVSAKVFCISLVSIKTENDVKTMVYDRLMSL